MACFSPLKGYRSIDLTKNGKRKLVFTPKEGFIDLPMTVPCGGCLGCRIDRSRQWAIRCEHEMSLHDLNCFITLTYAPEFLPRDRSLNVKHFQDFMKRFRKRVGIPIRFFHCGEYGADFGRPHYHAIIFGYDFPDKKFFINRKGNDLYRSDLLESLWPFGYSSVGSATWQSAAYVARYIMKKVTGDASDDHYRFIDESTGECFERRPEYTTMSRRPGIGKLWFDSFSSDVFPSDEVITRAGKRMKPPKYYDTLYEVSEPEVMEFIKGRRKSQAASRSDDNTSDRLVVREKVLHARLGMLKRDI